MSQPNFLASIGYKISLAMVLRLRATRAGSAIVGYQRTTRKPHKNAREGDEV